MYIYTIYTSNSNKFNDLRETFHKNTVNNIKDSYEVLFDK